MESPGLMPLSQRSCEFSLHHYITKVYINKSNFLFTVFRLQQFTMYTVFFNDREYTLLDLYKLANNMYSKVNNVL